MMTRTLAGAVLAALTAGGVPSLEAADPLPSWNDGEARRSIVALVETVTRRDVPDPEHEAVAATRAEHGPGDWERKSRVRTA